MQVVAEMQLMPTTLPSSILKFRAPLGAVIVSVPPSPFGGGPLTSWAPPATQTPPSQEMGPTVPMPPSLTAFVAVIFNEVVAALAGEIDNDSPAATKATKTNGNNDLGRLAVIGCGAIRSRRPCRP